MSAGLDGIPVLHPKVGGSVGWLLRQPLSDAPMDATQEGIGHELSVERLRPCVRDTDHQEPLPVRPIDEA